MNDCILNLGIARGMSYLHSLRTPTIHGDFKPSDVLIPANDLLTPKIANFGLWDFKKYFAENTLPGKKQCLVFKKTLSFRLPPLRNNIYSKVLFFN